VPAALRAVPAVARPAPARPQEKHYIITLFYYSICNKFLLASLKTLTNSINCSESASNFCSGLPSLSLVDIFQCKFMAFIQNNFQDHRRLSDELLVSQAAIGNQNKLT
jgi:hypothetical protein